MVLETTCSGLPRGEGEQDTKVIFLFTSSYLPCTMVDGKCMEEGVADAPAFFSQSKHTALQPRTPPPQR